MKHGPFPRLSDFVLVAVGGGHLKNLMLHSRQASNDVPPIDPGKSSDTTCSPSLAEVDQDLPPEEGRPNLNRLCLL